MKTLQKIDTLVVDDEKKARDGLVSLLRSISEVSIKGVCKDGLEAIDFLNNHQVDLIFLDIQMPGINGFDVLKSINEKLDCIVIFVTAYDQFALKAFEYHAFDYLLKPFTNKRFFDAYSNAKKNLHLHQNFEISRKLNKFLDNLDASKDSIPRIISESTPGANRFIIKESGKIIILEYNQIDWIEAYDYYLKIHTIDKVHVIKDSLKNLEIRLPSNHFIRIHKSSIVNINKIKQIEHLSHGEYNLVLKNNSNLKVSRNYRQNLLSCFNI